MPLDPLDTVADKMPDASQNAGAHASQETPPPAEPAKRRGRPPGAKNKKPGDTPPPPNASFVSVDPAKPTAAQTGVQIANLIVGLSCMIGGEDFAPVRNEQLGIDELALMQGAWSRYAMQKQWAEMPPSLELAFVMGSYYAGRVMKPKFRTRLSKAKDWLGSKYMAWKVKRNAQAGANSNE